MPQSTLPRLGLTDFLGTLPGGFYTLLILYSVMNAAGVDFISSGTWQNGSALPATIIVFMASFLIGSIYRAVPVKLIARDNDFPYPERITKCLETLRESSPAVGHIPSISFTLKNNDLIDDDRAMMVFDFWKAVIGHLSPNAFNHIKSLEAKVRFLVGMVSATMVGLLIWGVGLLAWCIGLLLKVVELDTNSWDWGWPLVCSLVLLGCCRLALRLARKEEVSEVVWSYVAVLQNSPGRTLTNSAAPPSEG